MLKRMGEFKRDDYTYTSPDGDNWEITIIQTADKKYIEIRKGDEIQASWDVDMLLDIADVIRKTIYTKAPTTSNPQHSLKQPSITDHRQQDSMSPSDRIQASVDQSLEKDIDTVTVPSESFVQHMNKDIQNRKTTTAKVSETTKKVKKAGISSGELV